MKGVDPKCMLFQKNGPLYGNLDLQPLHFNFFAPLRFLMGPYITNPNFMEIPQYGSHGILT